MPSRPAGFSYVVEYITEDGLFSIDLALRPPPGQTGQPAAAVANAEPQANDSIHSSNGSSSMPAEPQHDGAQEHQVRRCQTHRRS